MGWFRTYKLEILRVRPKHLKDLRDERAVYRGDRHLPPAPDGGDVEVVQLPFAREFAVRGIGRGGGRGIPIGGLCRGEGDQDGQHARGPGHVRDLEKGVAQSEGERGARFGAGVEGGFVGDQVGIKLGKESGVRGRAEDGGLECNGVIRWGILEGSQQSRHGNENQIDGASKCQVREFGERQRQEETNDK